MVVFGDDLVDPRHIKYHHKTFVHMAMIATNVRMEYEQGGKTNMVKNLGEHLYPNLVPKFSGLKLGPLHCLLKVCIVH